MKNLCMYTLGRIMSIVEKQNYVEKPSTDDMIISPLDNLKPVVKKLISGEYDDDENIKLLKNLDDVYEDEALYPASLNDVALSEVKYGYDKQTELDRFDNTQKTIGSRIGYLRKLYKLKSVDFAKLCGFSQSNISKLENGNYNISINVLARIVTALGCDLRIEDNEIS